MKHLSILVTPIVLLFYWQIIAASGVISSYLLPSPQAVWDATQFLWQSDSLIRHINTSLERVLIGFTISTTIAFLLAALVSSSIWIERLLSAPLALLRMIPPLAMTPLLILWLGIGNTTQLAIIILASMFPVFLNTRDGLRRVDPLHKELAQSLSLTRWRYITKIVIPSAIPSIVTGLRLGFGYSWRALVGAELIAASSGLGYLIIDSQEMMRTDEVMVGILTIGIIGWLLDNLYSQMIRLTLGRRFPEVCR